MTVPVVAEVIFLCVAEVIFTNLIITFMQFDILHFLVRSYLDCALFADRAQFHLFLSLHPKLYSFPYYCAHSMIIGFFNSTVLVSQLNVFDSTFECAIFAFEVAGDDSSAIDADSHASVQITGTSAALASMIIRSDDRFDT